MLERFQLQLLELFSEIWIIILDINANEKFQTIIDVKLLQITVFSWNFNFNLPHMKRNLIVSIINCICKLPPELLNDLSLGILGNLEMKRKFQKWEETKASVQSPLQKSKYRYQNFLVLCNFAWFSDFWQNIFSLTVAVQGYLR